MKEFFRKKLVWLKRNPQMFAMLFVLVELIIATFTLNVYSPIIEGIYNDDYVADLGIKVPAMLAVPAVYIFIQTLLAILLVITFLSVYKRGKRNNFMLSVSLAMIAILVFCDVMYVLSMNYFLGPYGGSEFLDVPKINGSIASTIAHLVVCVIAAALALLTPVIKKLLDKINTSIEDDYDEKMDQKTDEELMIELED